MRIHTRIIHYLVFNLRLEPLFFLLSTYLEVFKKFIPLPTYYEKSSNKIVKRDNVYFDLMRRDYMQWHIYAGIHDFSWLCATQFLSNNSQIIDIGANSGAFSLKLAKYGRMNNIGNFNVFSIEPNPFILEFLERNLALNEELKSNIEVCSLAIGNEDGYCSISFSEDNSGAGHVIMTEENNVKMQKLDTFVDEREMNNVGFIKIDVEGFEPEVLKGAKQTIRKYKPSIFIEMTDKWFRKLGSSTAEIIDELISLNYELLVETPRGMVPVKDPIRSLKDQEQYNLLARQK